MTPSSSSGDATQIALHPELSVSRTIFLGATEVVPVSEAHGWLRGRIQAPFGHHWEIGNPLT